jgi:hypothetical protein
MQQLTNPTTNDKELSNPGPKGIKAQAFLHLHQFVWDQLYVDDFDVDYFYGGCAFRG